MTEFIFWFSLLALFYGVIGYPVSLYLIKSVKKRLGYSRNAVPDSNNYQPDVTFVIAAYNEAESIEAKIENCLIQDYPGSKIEIIIGSDASEDGTDEIVEKYRNQGVILYRNSNRTGKIGILNKCIPMASGELIILTDANVMLEKDCVTNLVRHFVSPSIGAVCGNQLVRKGDNEVAGGESTYWEYDKLIKKWEMEISSTVSTDGSIYAIRKSLFRGIPEGVMDDLVISFEIIRSGARIIYDEKAVAIEDGVEKSSQEYRRRVRIVQMSLKGIWLYRDLLNFFRYGWYSYILFCHKILRRLQPVFIILFFLSSINLFGSGLIYTTIFYLELIFLAMGIAGPVLAKGGKNTGLLQLPYYFLLGNLGTLVGLLLFLSGKKRTSWQPIRSS